MSTDNIYSDINMGFGRNIYNDVSKVLDVNAIKQAVKLACLMEKGERPFNPVGSELNRLLFEPIDDDFIKDLIIDEIEQILKKVEPRVDEIEITVDDNLDQNEIGVDIQFSVKNSEEIYYVDFILYRVR